MITAKDLCKRDGMDTHVQWIHKLCKARNKIGMLDTPFTGKVVNKNPIKAIVDFGRWGARCECGGFEYVCKDEKIFYCFSCGNYDYGGNGRKVKFPAANTMRIIEQVLNKREVIKRAGTERLGRALLAIPKISGLSRCWYGESMKELKERDKRIRQSWGVNHGI